MEYYLQKRWKLEERSLVYYGLRNKENLFKNTIKLSKKQSRIIGSLPKTLDEKECVILKKFIGKQVVLKKDLKKIPKSLKEAKFCKECVANDYMIPGLELNDFGLCPLCQTKELAETLKSVVPILNEIPKSKKSRFDVGLFYTGGKDSTYLLYYLSEVLQLRVLAMTWEIPFISSSAKASIENAKRKLANVEFITKKINDNDLRKIYNKLYSLNENTCACPSLAYILFYPDLVENKVPYFVVGNEPVQMLGLYYNQMAPKIAYRFSNYFLLNLLINIFRMLTLRPPFKKGQLHTLMTMKQLAYGDSFVKKISKYKNELVSNVVASIHEVKSILIPLKRSIRRSTWTGSIPRFVHIDLNDISGGIYDWQNVKEIIIDKCGWVAPEEKGKGLHTSCSIEKCKEYSQFQRFYHMRSKMIPFSALEIALASRNKNITREEAVYELERVLGFSLTEIPECKIMKDYLGAK
ncbi:MAG TPA: hypothetical protein GX692_07775 [Acholeplasmataceae bacterium]|nr:hypothetical protein [Acholeplasmataceae bacterium]